MINLVYRLIIVLLCAGISSAGTSELPGSDTGSERSQDRIILPRPVTGSLLDLKPITSPMCFSVISQQDIRESGARNLTELLEIYVPGFQYMVNPFYGTLWGMRGISSDRNTKFIVLVNNHMLNMQSRDGFKSELVLGLLDDIERIEILRGPASLVYGSGAMAGIVNIITREEKTDTTDVHLTAGPTDGTETGVYLSRCIGRNSYFRGSFGWKRSEGLGIHQSRLYGIPPWPFPSPDDATISPDDFRYDGVPSNGSSGSTPGNWKFSGDWDWEVTPWSTLKTYVRYTHQVENIAGWVIIDPWPEIVGTPPAGMVQRIIRIDTADVLRGDTVFSKNGEMLGMVRDETTYLSNPSADPALRRYVDGTTVTPENSFWKATESYGENRRQYINENLAAEVKYQFTPPRFEKNVNVAARFGIDNAGNKTLYEQLPQYAAVDAGAVSYLEQFGEQRYLLGVLANGKAFNPRNFDLQYAFGAEGRWDIIGKSWGGKNQYTDEPLHKVVDDVTYFTRSVYTEMLLSFIESRKSDKILNFNGGIRYDYRTKGDGMLNWKAALVAVPPPAGNVEYSLKTIVQRSSNYGSADNYERNRFNFDDSGEIRDNDYPVYEKPFVEPGLNSIVVPGYTAPSLESERIYSWETVGYLSFLNEMLVVTPSFSTNRVDNLFVWAQSRARVINSGYYRFDNFDLDSRFNFRRITFGVNHTIQKPVVNSDAQNSIDSVIRYTRYIVSRVNGVTRYYPDPESRETKLDTLNIVGDAITADGGNFLNLSTQVTKFYLTVRPRKWVSLHTDCRLFWGLPGRAVVQARDAAADGQFNYWNIERAWPPVTKLDLSVHLYLMSNMTLSLYAYNLLGIDSGDPENSMWNSFLVRNSLRWLQIADPTTRGLVSADQQSFALRLTSAF